MSIAVAAPALLCYFCRCFWLPPLNKHPLTVVEELLACPCCCHPQVGGLYWVASTRENVSPSLVLELLLRMYWICRDYFGYVSEEVSETSSREGQQSGVNVAPTMQRQLCREV
jgi:uncharacterized protein YbaR (Trm112 family)